MRHVEMAANSPLRSIFVLEMYHINVISERAGLRPAPLRHRLVPQMIKSAIEVCPALL